MPENIENIPNKTPRNLSIRKYIDAIIRRIQNKIIYLICFFFKKYLNSPPIL